jgi:hypothetical protein
LSLWSSVFQWPWQQFGVQNSVLWRFWERLDLCIAQKLIVHISRRVKIPVVLTVRLLCPLKKCSIILTFWVCVGQMLGRSFHANARVLNPKTSCRYAS